MQEIEAAIEADRKKLAEEKDMADEERGHLSQELAKRERDLEIARYGFGQSFVTGEILQLWGCAIKSKTLKPTMFTIT